MLILKYESADVGAPDSYGTTTDWLEAGDTSLLQPFPKSAPHYAPPEAPLSDALDAWLATRADKDEPVIVMVHGYQFDPGNVQGDGTDTNSPLKTIYGYPPDTDYHLSWLPVVGECDNAGANRTEKAVAFCYKSESGVAQYGAAGWVNSYQYAALDQSPLAARALATILVSLSAKVRRVRILAHSLGTRTTSQALRLARGHLAGALDRVVLLDGAEFSVDAAASFENCAFDVFSITNRTDRVLQIGGDQACHPIRVAGTKGACTIGYDGLGGNDRCLDLQLDDDELVTWFADRKAPSGQEYHIDAAAEENSHSVAFMHHWSCYTNDGNRALLRDLLFHDGMTVAAMQAAEVPDGTDSVTYGSFNDVDIPPTPQTKAQRVAELTRVDLGGGV